MSTAKMHKIKIVIHNLAGSFFKQDYHASFYVSAPPQQTGL